MSSYKFALTKIVPNKEQLRVSLFVLLLSVVSSIISGQSYVPIPLKKDSFYTKYRNYNNYYDSWVSQIKGHTKEIVDHNRHWNNKCHSYWNRYITYCKALTDDPSDIIILFLDMYTYAPHNSCRSYYGTQRSSILKPKNLVIEKYYSKQFQVFDALCDCLNKTYNQELMNILKDIDEKDQRYRGSGSSVSAMIADGRWDKQIVLDSLNLIKAKEIIDKYGYPDRSLVGLEYEESIFYVIQHSNIEMMIESLPMIKEKIDAHLLNPVTYPMLFDRIEMLQGRPQHYGTQYLLDKRDEKDVLYDVYDSKNLNKRRAEYCLPLVEGYN